MKRGLTLMCSMLVICASAFQVTAQTQTGTDSRPVQVDPRDTGGSSGVSQTTPAQGGNQGASGVSQPQTDPGNGEGVSQVVPQTNDPNDPDSMAGANIRVSAIAQAGLGRIRVANRTRYFIRIYANHTFVSWIGPHRTLWCNAPEGRYHLRAVARLDDGSILRWEPYRMHVEADEMSSWTLRY